VGEKEEMVMRRASLVVVVVLLGFAGRSVLGKSPAAAHKNGAGGWVLFVPGEIEWKAGPDSLAPGAKVAILEGDPAAEGFFTMRVMLPDGYRVAPHWHPKTERLTIISGTLNLGTGDRFDAAATRALPAGTYSSMPPKMTHFAWTTGETVLQLSSIGPWQVIYVDPADDPRSKHR